MRTKMIPETSGYGGSGDLSSLLREQVWINQPDGSRLLATIHHIETHRPPPGFDPSQLHSRWAHLSYEIVFEMYLEGTSHVIDHRIFRECIHRHEAGGTFTTVLMERSMFDRWCSFKKIEESSSLPSKLERREKKDFKKGLKKALKECDDSPFEGF